MGITTSVPSYLGSVKFFSPRLIKLCQLSPIEVNLAMSITNRRISANQRRDAAFEFAQIGHQNVLNILISIVEGNRIRPFTSIRLDDQLLAVEALAKTNSPFALEHLKKLYTPIIWNAQFESYLVFPNAKGELRVDLLLFRGVVSDKDSIGQMPCSHSDFEKFYKRSSQKSQTHEIIRKAISMLQDNAYIIACELNQFGEKNSRYIVDVPEHQEEIWSTLEGQGFFEGLGTIPEKGHYEYDEKTIENALSILQKYPPEKQQEILSHLDKINPELAALIRKRIR